MSKSSRKHGRATTTRATATAAASRGLQAAGINYRPAIAAITDLAAWVFDIAAADVDDWPEGIRRIRSARRHVMSRIAGKRRRSAPIEDVLFAAGLLVRIFEAELSLSMSDVVGILDALDLPTEVVPLTPQVQPSSRMSPSADVTRLRPRGGSASHAAMPPCGVQLCLPRRP